MQRKSSTIWQRLGRCFMAGLLAVLPIALTVAIVIWVTGFVEGFVGPNTVVGRAIERVGLKFASDETIAYVIGWVLVIGAVFVLGLVVEMGAKRVLQKWVDALLQRIPLVGSVYGTSKQLVEMLDRKDESELKGMSVVFCVFGANGPGVLALMPSPERFHIDGQDYHVVIIPTAPVPFGGGLLFMPAEWVQLSDMSVDGLMSIYVSMGVTAPQFLNKP
jgi:uncharacterized membrane protein